MADTRSPSDPRIEPKVAEIKEESASEQSAAPSPQGDDPVPVTAGETDGTSDRTAESIAAPAAIRPGPVIQPVAASPAAAQPATTMRAPKARGRWLAVSAAVVALAAAGLSIAGPSLRPEIATQLTRQFGPQPWIAYATGTALPPPPDAVTINLAAFDQRLSALAGLLGQQSGQAGASQLDAGTIAALTTALGQPLPPPQPSPEAPRIAALEQQVTELSAKLAAADAALQQASDAARQAQTDLTSSINDGLALAATDTTRRIEASATAITEELSRRVEAIAQAGTAAHQALVKETETRTQDLASQLTARIEAGTAEALSRIEAAEKSLQAQETAVATRIDGIAAQAARGDAAIKLALLSRLRFAFELSTPFAEDSAALIAHWKSDEAETKAALAVLQGLGDKGVSSMSRLQRDLMAVMNGLVQAHTAPPPGWINQATVMLGLTAEEAPSAADQLREQGRVIAQEIHNGRIGAALWKLRALDVPLDERAQAWMQEATRRIAADEALATLNNRLLKTSGGA